MKNKHEINSILSALLLATSYSASAEWAALDSSVDVSQSSARYVRAESAYIAQVKATNNSENTISGPFRVLIENASLNVKNADGLTEDGVPYFDFLLDEIAPGAAISTTVSFEYARRTRLSFAYEIQNNASIDADGDGVNDDIDQCPATGEGEDVDDAGCALIDSDSGWALVWRDEFNGNAIDDTKWTHEVNCDGGGNNEKQCYTASSDNAYLENGVLKIVAKPESDQALPYSSARLISKEKGDWTYGRFEIRAKAPSGQGAWPAIWMLPTDWKYGGWPHSGEIDIFEAVNLGVPLDDGQGSIENKVHGTLHYGKSWPNNAYSGHSYTLPDGENPADDFHVYAVEWQEGEIRWYVDGVLYQTQLKSEVSYNSEGQADGLVHKGWFTEQDGENLLNNAPFDERFHLLLNFAVGGNWPEAVNQGGIDASAFDGQNSFDVDYVRVFECSVSPSTGEGCATVTDNYLDPKSEGGTLINGAAPAPTAPSDGIARDLIIFADDMTASWPAWDCCGGTNPNVVFDEVVQSQVIEFTVGGAPTVLGFNTNVASSPSPFDASPIYESGVLEFDLKLVTAPNNAAAGWNVKVEQGNAATAAQVSIATPTETWQHYSIPVKTLSDAGLNLNGIDIVMLFPDWGQGEGAVFRVDNLRILQTPSNGADNGEVESNLPAFDFEPEGLGAALNWNVFENSDNPPLEFVANPDTSGINSSSTVAKITARVDGAPWVGTEIQHGQITPFTLDESNSIVKMMVYKSVISDVGVKFAIASGGAQGEIKVANTKVNEWEELTFDFSDYIGRVETIDIDQVIVFPDFDFATREQDNLVYFDNIRFYGSADDDTGDNGSGGEDGGDNGGEHPEQEGELIGNGGFTNGSEGWVGTVNVISDNGNNVFMADVAVAGNPWDVNLSQVMTLVPGETYELTFKAKASVARSIIAGLGMNYAPWKNVAHTVALSTSWQTFTYTITAAGFGDDNSRVFFDLGAQAGVVYIDDVSVVVKSEDDGGDNNDGGDNGANTLATFDFESAGFGAELSWNVFENSDNSPLEFVANPDSSGINDSSTVAKITARVDGAPWVGTEIQHGQITPFTLDESNSIVKMMVYKSVISDVGVKFAIASGGAQGEIKVANTKVNEWEELTFDFSGYIGLVETIDIDQIIVFPDFATRTQDNVVYFDNIRLTNGDDVITPQGWNLVWSDEFSGTSIDQNKWTHEVNCDGGGNNEKQCYTASSDNSFVENGVLNIVAKAAANQPLPYSSARLISKNQGDWTYGRFEIRAKAPSGQGAWPAIWMLPTDQIYGGWPHSGEIDIFEAVNLGVALNDDGGNVESYVHGTLHYGQSWPNNDSSGHSYLLPDGENPADDFHVYAIEWEEGEIRWYVDGVLYETQRKSTLSYNDNGDANGLAHRGWYTEHSGDTLWNNAPFDERFHLLLNFAVGGSWPEAVNQGGVDASAFDGTNRFLIDYVRVYECANSPSNGLGCATITEGYGDSVENGGTLINGAAPIPVPESDGIARDLLIFDDAINPQWPAWDCCGDSNPMVVFDEDAQSQVVEFTVGATPTVLGFNTNFADVPSPFDASPIEANGTLEFDLKLVTPTHNASAAWNLKVEQGGASTEAVVTLATPTPQWQHYSIEVAALKQSGLSLNGIDVVMIFPDWGQGEGAVFRVDNMQFLQGEDDGSGDDGGNNGDDGGTDPVVGDELVANGSFENGSEGWIGDVSIVEDTTSADGNHVFQADIAMAGNPWDVNLSQVMTLTSGATYTVTFKAKASKVRDMLVGLGLNHDPWTNVTQSVGLTTDWQNYTFTLTANGFGDDNSRVFFDLGADNGVVQIDDVSVVQVETTGGDNGGPAEQEFVLISSTDETDIDFLPSTVGEWSTGTTIQSDVMFDGLLGWELTSSSNSPEQGNWGTVLAFQNGINGDFSLFNRIELTLATTGHFAGGYKIAISANGVNKEISLPVNESISTWQSIVLDMADIPLNLSQVDWIAVYGIGGQSGVSQIHLTDFSLLKSAAIEFDSNTENDFVFISSDASVSSDLIVDNDNYSDAGNVIFGEWSTGTMISSTQYAGLNGLRLAANGSWGAVLALQGDISDGVNIDNYDVDFSQYTNLRFKAASQGAFERYAVSIVSKIGDGEVAQEVGFTLANQADWNEIDIDLAMYGVNLSHVSQIAIFGVYQGGSASQSLYITDLVMYDTGKVVANSKDSSDDKFVFFSSTGEDTDMVFDGDDSAHNGNMTISEWSTGTTFNSEVIYNGLSAFQLIRGSASWGAVLALMGDIYGDVQEYSIDVAQYKTLNFKIAAQGGFSEYTLDFVVDGAEHKIPLTVNSNWRDVTIDLTDVPLNLSKLTQIAIFGVGGGQGNSIYITDMNLSQ